MTRARDLSNDEANGGGATPPFVAGKNRLINGDFSVWQRGTSLSVTTNAGAFLADRFLLNFAGTFTGTLSQQTFTPGTAPVAGYEGQFFARIVRTGTTSVAPTFYQRVENVRTFAGQTVTFSFWAKADAARSVGIQAYQAFGTSGSGATDNNAGTAALTTSWQRFSFTYTMPSVAGKTISASNDSWMTFYWSLPDSTAFTIDTWGWQLEAGSVATPFTPAGGGLPGAELALCQRYYYRINETGATNRAIGNGIYYTSTNVSAVIPLPVTMRISPAIDQSTGTDFYGFVRNGGIDGFSSFTADATGRNAVSVYNNTDVSGTVGQGGLIVTLNSNAYLGFTAEL